MACRQIPAAVGVVLLVLGGALSGCSGSREAPTGPPRLEGKASYYAGKFVGRQTANGEIYDPDAMTAAHRQLPFGTVVRVTRTDRSGSQAVVVRINDRGPFVDGRIIDLSKAAARKLDMIVEGVVPVQLEILERSTARRERPSERLNW